MTREAAAPGAAAASSSQHRQAMPLRHLVNTEIPSEPRTGLNAAPIR